MKWIPTHISKDDRILEVGCGTGLFGYWLRNQGYQNYVGVDIRPELIKIAREHFSLDYRIMDGRNLEFEDKSFDFVGYINCFFNFRPLKTYDCEAFLDEGIRVSSQWLEFDTAFNRLAWEAPTFTQTLEWLEHRGLENNIIEKETLPGNRRIWIMKL